jgi:hypothetical protein
MWDSEMPLGQTALELGNWWSNRTFLDRWFKDRQLPTHVWRSHTSMGLDPVFLRLVALDSANQPPKYIFWDWTPARLAGILKAIRTVEPKAEG